jgi:hypothetical protein
LIFLLVAVVVALCLSACNGNGGSWDITTTSLVVTTRAPEDFNDAFAIRGITFEKHQFSTPQSASFVGLTTDDTLELVELGYDGNTVKEVFNALYINIEQYDAAQKESIKQGMESNSAQAATIPGVTITHKIVDKYYIMTTEIKVFDNADTFDAAVRAGLLDFTNEGALPLKVSDVENVLIAKGFIKM